MTTTVKTCFKCNTEKQISEFYKHAKEGEDLRKRERVDEVEALGNTIRELYARATGETE